MEGKDLKHILIVDDEPDLIHILGVILTKTKRYKVSGAEDGNKALDFLSKNSSVELVLADIKMPEMDGLALIKKIKERNLEKPEVVFLTGFTDIPLDEIYDAGACGFVSKPFDWEKIISVVDEALLLRPKYKQPFKKEEIKADINIELESIEAAQLYSDNFTLGRAGFFITIPQQVFTGDLVSFKISFLGGDIKNIDGVGQVIWYNRTKDGLSHLGLKFHNIEPELETFIEKFCNKNSVSAFIPRR
jgi:CheY-like chemotaxis protein